MLIGAMDATTSTVPTEYELTGYPSLYFKPAGGQPKQYTLARDIQTMSDFIVKHSLDVSI